MKNRSKLKFLVVAIIAVVGLMAILDPMRQDQGPEYQGRALDSWMRDLPKAVPYWQNRSLLINGAPGSSADASTSDTETVAKAIYEIGTNAIPYLVEHYFGRRKPKSAIPDHWRRPLFALNRKYFPSVPIISQVLPFEPGRARTALFCLKEKSVHALPMVLGLVEDGTMSTTAEKELYVLLVENQNDPLGATPNEQLNQVILGMSTNASELNSEQLILLLWTIQTHGLVMPELVPVIAPLLTHPNSMVQHWAINTIARFGPVAASTLPALDAIALEHQNLQAATAAREAIQLIRPGEPAKPAAAQ